MASQPIFCVGCWQNMKLPIALRTIAAVPYRAVGIRQSRMNPNICTICETMFERVMKARQVEIDATILFADLRGYTSLSQSQSSGAIAKLLDAFYDVCGEAIWEHDGIINKTMGDAVLAVFNFPIKHRGPCRACGRGRAEDPGALARAARRAFARLRRGGRNDRRRNWPRHRQGQFRRVWPHAPGPDRDRHGGERRLPRAERGGADQILITAAVREKAAATLPESAGREYQLKGIDAPAKLWAA